MNSNDWSASTARQFIWWIHGCCTSQNGCSKIYIWWTVTVKPLMHLVWSTPSHANSKMTVVKYTAGFFASDNHAVCEHVDMPPAT